MAEAVVKADPRVLADPEPVIAVADLAYSSVNLHIRPWVKTADYFLTMCELKEEDQDCLRRQWHFDPLPPD